MKGIFRRYYLWGLLLLMVSYTAKINWSDGQWQNVLETDARGYYAYLPAIFLYDDLNFDFFETVENNLEYDTSLYYDYRSYSNGHTINKYFVGEAVLLTPFFAGGHVTAKFTGATLDGYSQPYMISITLAAIFYWFIGLLALHNLLKTFNIHPKWIALTLVGFTLGSHLFYYTIGEMGMTHVYSFALISMFLSASADFFRVGRWQQFILMCFWLGLIVLVRPVNGIVVFALPFMARDYSTFKNKLTSLIRRPKLLASGALIVFVIAAIQPLIYFQQTGSFWVDSYGNEGFNFLQPHVFDFLFSYRKGLFVYTPLCLLSLCGLWFLSKSRYQFWSMIGFLTVVVYTLSSWWMWYYGGSYSARPMVEYLPFFMILFALLLQKTKRKTILLTLTVAFILLNQFQTLQYRYYLIHWSEMNSERYWNVFLDVDGLMKKRNCTDSNC